MDTTVISLKKLLNADTEATDSILAVAQLLLEGIGTHAIRCDPEEYVKFRESMELTAAALAVSSNLPESMLQAGAAIRSLEDYNLRTAQQLRVRGSELQGMVTMLTAAIGEISTAGEENVSRLRRIEGMVASVTQSESIRAIKEQLSVCLEEIRQEATRQKSTSANAVYRLRQDLELAQPDPFADTVTGLPVRAPAVELISKACESGQTAIAAVMVIDRLPAVHAAFGPETGDQLLRHFAGYLRRSVPSGDQLFRWTGTSLLVLVGRAIKIEALRGEIGYLMEQKLEYTVRTATRSVRLPVTARWTLFPMMPSSRLLIEKLDRFASMKP
jgi:GGDEF domain-containing protein